VRVVFFDASGPPVGYARPKGAAVQRLSLVPAYTRCNSPNALHGPPSLTGASEPDGSCTPPAPTSNELTVGTNDANAKPARSIGSVRRRVLRGNSTTLADEADVTFRLSITDVRNADLTDYTGELLARPELQVTDRQSGPSGSESATGLTVELPFAVPCQETLGAPGATCAITTTADGLVPGLVVEGKRALWELGQVRVDDGGTDGDADTAGDNSLFAVPGLFVP
jgi:hypothetical protein